MSWFSARAAVVAGRQNSRSDETEILYWAALIITGNPDAAKQSIVDAGALADRSNYAFRDWLVRWGRSATARAGVNTIRAFIHETAAQYAGKKCLHRAYQPLSAVEIQSLRELDPQEVVKQLDILARTTLVLYGCGHASLSECALVLDVPLEIVVAAYCRALDWYHEFAGKADEAKHAHFHASGLHLVRYDSDGVPVWDSNVAVHSTR